MYSNFSLKITLMWMLLRVLCDCVGRVTQTNIGYNEIAHIMCIGDNLGQSTQIESKTHRIIILLFVLKTIWVDRVRSFRYHEWLQ